MAQRRKGANASTPAATEPAKTEEAPKLEIPDGCALVTAPGVYVAKTTTHPTEISVRVDTIGVQPTEVLTILEVAAKQVREQFGLS